MSNNKDINKNKKDPKSTFMITTGAVALAAIAVPLALGLFPVQKAVDPTEPTQQIETTVPQIEQTTPTEGTEPNYDEFLMENNMSYIVDENKKLTYKPIGYFEDVAPRESAYTLQTMPSEGYKFVGWEDSEISYVVKDSEGRQYLIAYNEFMDGTSASSSAPLSVEHGDELYEVAGNFLFTIEGGLVYLENPEDKTKGELSNFLLKTTGGAQYEFVSWVDASITYIVEDENGVKYRIAYTETNDGGKISGFGEIRTEE